MARLTLFVHRRSRWPSLVRKPEFACHLQSHRELRCRVSATRARLVVQYDYASGDRSPDDRANNRFDLLFGARRFELGPTGLYGAIARSNISSPGVRLEVQSHRMVDAFAGYRLVWLASARDAWTTAALHDPSGNAGSFVGQQVEARARFHVLPRNLSFDVGGALFVRGAFAKHAPSNRRPSASARKSRERFDPRERVPYRPRWRIGMASC